MESLLADITMLRALFFEGLRKSSAQQTLQAASPGTVAIVQVSAAQGAFLSFARLAFPSHAGSSQSPAMLPRYAPRVSL